MDRPWIAIALALFLACGSDEAKLGAGKDQTPAPGDEPTIEKVRMGPLANAGPDQRALPGMVVRLDGRGTVPPEDGRPFRHLWLQEAGPRVHLSDPTSPIAEFVAPPIRPGGEARLVFRLVADDGALRSIDRMAVELVEESGRLVSAPALVAGADQEVRPGEEVELPPPSFVDPGCIEAEDPEACLADPLPFCWVQVEGPTVELLGSCGEEPTRLVAPERETLLVFRLDAHAARGLTAPQACGPESLIPAPTPLCAAPDYLRVVVRETPRRGTSAPTTRLRILSEERERVELLEIGGTAGEIPAVVNLSIVGSDREKWRLVPRFRPVLGAFDASQASSPLVLDAPSRPGPIGVAFDPWFYRHLTQGGQTRLEWLRAEPSLAVLAWKPPSDTPPLQAGLGERPCAATSPEGVCEPMLAGEEVILAGHFEGSGAQGCWEQTFGPRVDLLPAARCATDQFERRFVAPDPGSAPVELAFQFTVRDAGPYESAPSTIWIQIRPEGILPPGVVLEAPADLAQGESVELDASQSVDPMGGPLHFRWRQIEGPAVGLRGCNDLPQEGCMVLTAPLEVEGTAVLELEVGSEASGLISRRRISLPIGATPP